MLRMTDEVRDGVTAIKLEGKLCGPWVDEVRRYCETSAGQQRSIHLDLSSVSFVDEGGANLLHSLLARGASIGACSNYVAELLKSEMRS